MSSPARPRTAKYEHDIPHYGHVMTLNEFARDVKYKMIMDHDGHGRPANVLGKMAHIEIYPSSWYYTVPQDATHIIWFNK